MTQPRITVNKRNGYYVAECNGMILVASETAQGIANYMVAMQLVSYWDVRP